MNTTPNTPAQLNQDNDVFAYRAQATRLRSEAVKSAIKTVLNRTRAQFKQTCEQNDPAQTCQAA